MQELNYIVHSEEDYNDDQLKIIQSVLNLVVQKESYLYL
jgi:hypothetical protein